jgi:hypothetical protein
MTDTVTTFPKPAPPRPDLTRETGVALGGTQPGPIPRAATRSSAAPAVIEIDKLYPRTTGGSTSDVVNALGQLAEVIELLGQARIAAQKKDVVTADRCAQRFQATLPSLFMCRKIGDGYAVIVNSLHFAFVNQHGRPLSFEQFTTVWRILRELRNRPFIQFEQALDFVGELEECGLQVDPSIVSELVKDPEDE